MATSPTPMQRLLQLERDLGLLSSQLLAPADAAPAPPTPPPRAFWPSDLLLLTRLVRRSPIALRAYQAEAELSAAPAGGLHLRVGSHRSAYHFCELDNGDALLWPRRESLLQLWADEGFRELFHLPDAVDASSDLIIQTLAHFKPIARHQLWSLWRPGTVAHQPGSDAESAHQDDLQQRLERLERQMQQFSIRTSADVGALSRQLTLLQDHLGRLHSLAGFPYPFTPFRDPEAPPNPGQIRSSTDT